MFWSPTIFTLQCCNIVTIYTIKTNYYLIAFHQRFCENFVIVSTITKRLDHQVSMAEEEDASQIFGEHKKISKTTSSHRDWSKLQ